MNKSPNKSQEKVNYDFVDVNILSCGFDDQNETRYRVTVSQMRDGIPYEISCIRFGEHSFNVTGVTRTDDGTVNLMIDVASTDTALSPKVILNNARTLQIMSPRAFELPWARLPIGTKASMIVDSFGSNLASSPPIEEIRQRVNKFVQSHKDNFVSSTYIAKLLANVVAQIRDQLSKKTDDKKNAARASAPQ